MVRLALALLTWLALLAPAPASAQTFTGAGSTFAYQLLIRWSQAYQRAQRDAEYQPVGALFDYEPSGSEAGIQRLQQRAVDFGATEAPLSDEELHRYNAVQFPIVAGGIAIVTNIAGVGPGRLRLTSDLIAAIYAGRITRWSDPAIRADKHHFDGGCFDAGHFQQCRKRYAGPLGITHRAALPLQPLPRRLVEHAPVAGAFHHRREGRRRHALDVIETECQRLLHRAVNP